MARLNVKTLLMKNGQPLTLQKETDMEIQQYNLFSIFVKSVSHLMYTGIGLGELHIRLQNYYYLIVQ